MALNQWLHSYLSHTYLSVLHSYLPLNKLINKDIAFKKKKREVSLEAVTCGGDCPVGSDGASLDGSGRRQRAPAILCPTAGGHG